MSSETIDVGIDLGTSNSAVAVSVEGAVEVVKNQDNAETTPSVVRFLPNGSVQVGRAAYQFHQYDREGNSFSEFKKRMGSAEGAYVSAIRKSMIPEQLAAEILKSLRLDAEGFIGSPVSAAAITVPAAFELVQMDGTKRAAALAGISHAVLLQEPIAAGLAYGYDRELPDGYFLVYDLGAGTFDAALLQVSDGQLLVIDSEGDNFLGGKDMDRKLVGLVNERLAEAGFVIWEDSDPEGKEYRQRLRLIVEDAKIRLSRHEAVEVYLESQLDDADESPIELTIPLSRSEYEPLISDDIERTTQMVNRILQRQSLPADAVSKILMVGGPTYTPLVRRMIPALTGIAIETRIDPMTVVARGAARFAAAAPIPKDISSHVVTAGLTKLSLAFPTSTSDDIAHVGGRVEEVSAQNYSVEIRRSDGGWASGRIPVVSNAFMTVVELLPKRTSSFSVSCFDSQGRPAPVSPDSFSISQGLMAAEPPLARSIWVAARDSDETVSGVQLLKRGVSLPATGRATFKAAATVSPGEAVDVLYVQVFEGDYDSIELNRHVGYLEITGAQIGRTLPENTPIEITLRVDASRTATVRAYVPLLDETLEEILTNQILLPEDPREIRESLQRDRARSERLRDVAPGDVQDIQRFSDAIEEDLERAEGGDADASFRAERRRTELANQINQLTARYAQQLIENEIERFLDYTTRVADECGDAHQEQQLLRLRGASDQAIASGEKAALERVRDDIRDLYSNIVWECGSWWIGRFMYQADQARQAGLSRVVQPLVDRGQAAIQAENLPELRLVCQRLDNALPKDRTDGRSLDPRLVGLRT